MKVSKHDTGGEGRSIFDDVSKLGQWDDLTARDTVKICVEQTNVPDASVAELSDVLLNVTMFGHRTPLQSGSPYDSDRQPLEAISEIAADPRRTFDEFVSREIGQKHLEDDAQLGLG
jgi:hypothetical protein